MCATDKPKFELQLGKPESTENQTISRDLPLNIKQNRKDRMADNQFKMAYHNEGHAFVLSNGSVGNATGANLSKFDVHKRSVSSKKIRGQKKSKKSGGSAIPNTSTVGYPSASQNYRAVYQKLPT